MKLSDILEQWAADTKIDPLDLGNESLRSPLLHSKYVQYHAQENMVLKKLVREMKELKKVRWEFYSGKGTGKDYRDAGMTSNIRIMKADVPMYMESDQEINNLQDKIDIAEQKVQVLKEIISSINARNWIIRNAVEWRRFTEGG